VKIDLPDSLSDGAVSLRPLRADDADAFGQAFRDDPELGVAIGVEKDPDEATVRERIPRIAEHAAQGDSAELAIADPGSDAFLGVVVLVNFDWRHRRCEIGFWLAAQARRKGIARRSVALMLDWAFDVLEMRRVELTTLPENEATVRLAESLGFNREGLMRARNFERGRAVDVIWFGVLRDEWAARA
jgi:[ribosomal protein S5]-alanine N-acetyltransferase